MNLILLKQTFKINRKILFCISGLIAFFLIIMGIAFKIAISNNSNNNSSSDNSNSIGAIDISKIDDIKHQNSSMLVYMICSMFPMLFSILIMVYIIITSNSLIANQVDKGSMAYTLSTPISRKEISLTQTFYFVFAILFINLIMMCSSFISLGIVGETSSKQIAQISVISLGSFLFNVALSSILFMFSCTFNTSGKSFAFGAGFAILCYVFFMLGYMSEQGSIASLEWLKIFQYLSLNSLFIPLEVKDLNSNIIYQFIILILIAIIGYGIGNFTFSKRDLPL